MEIIGVKLISFKYKENVRRATLVLLEAPLFKHRILCRTTSNALLRNMFYIFSIFMFGGELNKYTGLQFHLLFDGGAE